jgi:hypothetical protein
MFNPKFRYILIFSWLLFSTIPGYAQTAGNAFLEPPDTADFPIIHTYLEVYDSQGRFVHDLNQRDVKIIEDQKQISVGELEELEAGVQFVMAVNLGPALGIRDSNGISRYTKVQGAILDWGKNTTTIHDNYSLVTNDSPEVIHLETRTHFINNFQVYQSDPRSATPSLDVLVRAINIASDPVPQIGMGRAILLITPPPNRTSAATIQSIISLARQERIRIYVWMISSEESFVSEGATLLVELSNQTGGQFYAFSGTEILPDIEGYLEPLRYVYSIRYESQIRNNEPHKIAAEIKTVNIELLSSPQDFNLSIQPPNPIFLSPPIEISRANRASLSETLSEVSEYTPKVQDLEILVEFPDGIERPLQRTRLIVDGEVVDENISSPYDKFTWDLSSYNSSSGHVIQVEAHDSLGLVGLSIENSVQISVHQTPQSVISTIAQNSPIIAGAVVAFAGGVLLLVLIVKGRIKPRAFGQRKKNKVSAVNNLNQEIISTSTPEESQIPRQRLSNWANRIAWPQRPSQTQKPIAHLEILDHYKERSEKERIPITHGEITFGNDPKLATITFNDPAVEGLHARLRMSDQGDIIIRDEGSIAGTWVNYSPISWEDVKLSHGDIIHIAHIGLCLKMTDKKLIPKPIIRSLETGS